MKSATLNEYGWCDIHEWQAEESEQSECEKCFEEAEDERHDEVCDTCGCKTGFLTSSSKRITCDKCYTDNQRTDA